MLLSTLVFGRVSLSPFLCCCSLWCRVTWNRAFNLDWIADQRYLAGAQHVVTVHCFLMTSAGQCNRFLRMRIWAITNDPAELGNTRRSWPRARPRRAHAWAIHGIMAIQSPIESLTLSLPLKIDWLVDWNSGSARDSSSTFLIFKSAVFWSSKESQNWKTKGQSRAKPKGIYQGQGQTHEVVRAYWIN